MREKTQKRLDYINSLMKISCDYNDLDSAIKKIKCNVKSHLIIYKDNVQFDFLVNIKPQTVSKKMIVFGSGALPFPDEYTDQDYIELQSSVPYFPRLTWNVKCSSIYYADATKIYYGKQNKMLSLGWNIGTDDHWFLKTVYDILIKLFDYFKFERKNILLYGSSGGGTQSILLGAMFKTCKIMVDCPQLCTSLHSAYAKYKLCNENVECDDIYLYRRNVIECFKHFNYIPQIIINESFGNGDMTQLNWFLTNFKKEIENDNLLFTQAYNKISINLIPENKHTYISLDDLQKKIDKL